MLAAVQVLVRHVAGFLNQAGHPPDSSTSSGISRRNEQYLAALISMVVQAAGRSSGWYPYEAGHWRTDTPIHRFEDSISWRPAQYLASKFIPPGVRQTPDQITRFRTVYPISAAVQRSGPAELINSTQFGYQAHDSALAG